MGEFKGFCRNCRYYDVRDYKEGGLFEKGRAYCLYGRQYVKGDSYCDAFEPVPTVSDGGCCFLTTAYVKYGGKDNDCYELTTMRKFRDEYLLKTASGRILVKEYYEIAPTIVEALEKREDKADYYKTIGKYINRCLELYSQNKYDEVVDTYYQMVKYLKEQLL